MSTHFQGVLVDKFNEGRAFCEVGGEHEGSTGDGACVEVAFSYLRRIEDGFAEVLGGEIRSGRFAVGALAADFDDANNQVCGENQSC